MKRAYFITATDTGAGKTFAASLMARVLKSNGVNIGVMKPVESGCTELGGSLIPEDAIKLREASGSSDMLDLITPYRFKEAVSPHIAARLAGTSIDFHKIKKCFLSLQAAHDLMLVEGAGGLLAPLTEDKTIADLITFLGIPALIVAPSRIGVINHASLTVECARNRGIKIAGIILNEISSSVDPSKPYNLSEIEKFTKTPVLFEIRHSKKEAPFPEEEGLVSAILKL